MVYVDLKLMRCRMQLFAVKFKLGNLVYIQNNKPYAERLENGWSDQAPQGIYGLTFNFISQKYGG